MRDGWVEPDWDDELVCELCGEVIAEGTAAEMVLPDGRTVICHDQCGLDRGGEVA